jgi:hypothetical protein
VYYKLTPSVVCMYYKNTPVAVILYYTFTPSKIQCENAKYTAFYFVYLKLHINM